ncbi:hypothetical protein KC343_g1996, partial [Hortaea werneckii]
MVVSNNVAPVTAPHPAPTTANMATENMDMDVDYSADQEEIARLQAEAERFDAQTNGTSDAFDSMTGMEEAAEEGEIDENTPETTKIYLQGVDR